MHATSSIVVFGRQPELGLAELEAIYGSRRIKPVSSHAAIISLPPQEIALNRLGGSVRLGALLSTLQSRNWQKITAELLYTIPEHAVTMPEGKIRIGISHIGSGVSVKQLNAAALELKKHIRAVGRSARAVPSIGPQLNAGQVVHNQLLGPTGCELLIIPGHGQAVIAQTMQLQDVAAYAARDQKRPKRDARVGMLPPKLAQIIINLAVSQPPSSVASARLSVLDPFCGTGVVLQEAMLMGYDAYGTDLEPRMIEYSQVNLEWLTTQKQLTSIYPNPSINYQLDSADATNHDWQQPFSTIACETYLGRPLSSLPAPDTLSEITSAADTIHRKFLANVARQTKPGFRMCIAVPAWKTARGFKHLKTLDNLASLGYNRVRFVHVDTRNLIYHRPDQLVARELVVLERI
ncbi:hypothetical protein CR970_03650 [Candidatus Saccharibacteria bacterium]|nr:MAG: hypothetical protein CR970_03650 [Candidatus Saccharibacteria bacterium]